MVLAMSESSVRHTFDSPGKYYIQVEGFLDESRSEYLGGMNITNHIREDNQYVTELVGILRDQAELAGVLNTLYEMHLTLLSVEFMDDE
jgi:hypothetical protein